MAENFPSLEKRFDIQINEEYKTPISHKQNKSIPNHENIQESRNSV